MNYAPTMMRRLVYDKPGRYEFQPGHYPGGKYIRVDVLPGVVVVEVWGYKEQPNRVSRIHRVMSMMHHLMIPRKGKR